MEDLNKLNSTESIPRQFVEKAEKHNRAPKMDQNGDYVRDSNGAYVYEVTTKGVKADIKAFASHFADYGVDINQINFDDYLVEGVTLDKIPRGALTVIQVDGSSYGGSTLSHFYVFDKRKDPARDNPLWESGTRTMYHSRKGRYVDVGRIPDYQFLQAAKNVWVIPEEILTRNPREIRLQRANNRRGRLERLKELPYKYYGYRGDPRRLDPSGYVIDPEVIKEKLEKYKKEKVIKQAGSYSALAEKEIETLVNDYNTMAKTILSVATEQLEKGDLRLKLGKVSEVSKEIKSLIQSLLHWAGRTDSNYSDSSWYFDSKLEDLKKYRNTYNWKELEDTYKEALEEEQINSSTEGRGCKYNRTLQATESYFTDSEILSAFEEKN